MAHALWNYNGACKNIHGHSYKLYVTLAGKPIENINEANNGMVMDFMDLKTLVKNVIIKEFDHSLLIHKNAIKDKMFINEQMFDRLKITDFQPTVENLLIHFLRIIN